MKEAAIILLVGLGNPGTQYCLTRHNIGFIVIDAIAKAYNAPPFKKQKNGLLTKVTVGPHTILLFKPQTYMNRSGHAVGPLCQMYKIPSQNIMVIHDDLELPF